jgi:hypothetical protein
LREAELVRPLPSNDDQVDSWGQQGRPSAEALAAQPFDTVASNGAAQLACDDYSQPSRSQIGIRLCGHEECKVRGGDPFAGSLRSSELGMVGQPSAAPEGESHVTPRLGRPYFL